jgi:hypothetical protein
MCTTLDLPDELELDHARRRFTFRLGPDGIRLWEHPSQGSSHGVGDTLRFGPTCVGVRLVAVATKAVGELMAGVGARTGGRSVLYGLGLLYLMR